MAVQSTPEELRLRQDARREQNWKRWGPYLAERQWGTVREDYSEDGDAWSYFPHQHARLRAYRWGEDGLLGICDRGCRLCFALALWNGRDPILKERLFGLSNPRETVSGTFSVRNGVRNLFGAVRETVARNGVRNLFGEKRCQEPFRRRARNGVGNLFGAARKGGETVSGTFSAPAGGIKTALKRAGSGGREILRPAAVPSVAS